jgi:hypothetical protein
MKKRAIKAGLKVVTNALSGGDVKAGLKKDAAAARDDLGESAAGLVGDIAKEVGGGGGGGGGGDKRKRKAALAKRKQQAKKRRRATTILDEL